MEFRHLIPGVSPSSPSDDEIPTLGNNGGSAVITTTNDDAPTMHRSWWESIEKARSRIHILSSLLSDTGDPNSISSLSDSDRPAHSLLSSATAYVAVSSSLTTSPASGAGDGPICKWLYDTYLSSDSDPDLHLFVLTFIPLIVGIYFSRIYCFSSPPPSVAGFEAVLLAVYSSEATSRAGKPILISIPDLSQPSVYHTPRVINNDQNPSSDKFNDNTQPQPIIGIVSPPLEPQTTIKSTKRATIVGVALECYYKRIVQMPDWSKLDFCKFVADWADQNCPCKSHLDEKPESTMIFEGMSSEEIEIEDIVLERMNLLDINDGNSDNVVETGTRIPLPWDLLQPILKILGHCLLAPLNPNDVKDAASNAVRSLYARSCHDLVPQGILATRSLIQLDKRANEAAALTTGNTSRSNSNKPKKPKKPEIQLSFK